MYARNDFSLRLLVSPACRRTAFAQPQQLPAARRNNVVQASGPERAFDTSNSAADEAGSEAERFGEGDCSSKPRRSSAAEKTPIGTTGALRVTLSEGKLTHDAQFQPIDVYKPVFHGAEGTVEKNFRDTYKFNIAAYRLGR